MAEGRGAQLGTEGREVWSVAEGRMPLVPVYACVCVRAGVRACCRCDAQTHTHTQMVRHSTHICY